MLKYKLTIYKTAQKQFSAAILGEKNEYNTKLKISSELFLKKT